MPFIDPVRTLPSDRLRREKLPAIQDPAEIQIQVMLPNDPGGQALALKIFRAFQQAHRTWQSSATLVGVQIMAVTATGGQIVGPPLAPLMLALAQGANDFERKLIGAIANGVGSSWLSFVSTVKVAGLPWYPAFAAFPGPVAPPMPNIPVPFMALTQVQSLVSSSGMKPLVMAGLLPDRSGEAIVNAVLSAVQQFLAVWFVKTMVTNVLGTGPVPSFAPPYVPVGPVVGGVGTMTPGGFI